VGGPVMHDDIHAIMGAAPAPCFLSAHLEGKAIPADKSPAKERVFIVLKFFLVKRRSF